MRGGTAPSITAYDGTTAPAPMRAPAERDRVRREPRPVLEPRVPLRPRPVADDALAADGHRARERRARADRRAGADPQHPVARLEPRAVADGHARLDHEPRAPRGAKHHFSSHLQAFCDLDPRLARGHPGPYAAAPCRPRRDNGIGTDGLLHPGAL